MSQPLLDLATLFLRIASTLEDGDEAGESLMLALDAHAWRRMAEIIQDELEPEVEFLGDISDFN